jgi:hypothetical protein
MMEADPFTGTWKYDPEKSQLSRPLRSWTQQIEITSDRVSVREEIVGTDGSTTVVSVEARFDGVDYPVSGSPLSDVISYARTGSQISGIAKKNCAISLRETLTVSADGRTLTQAFAIFAQGKQLTSATAIFDKVFEVPESK